MITLVVAVVLAVAAAVAIHYDLRTRARRLVYDPLRNALCTRDGRMVITDEHVERFAELQRSLDPQPLEFVTVTITADTSRFEMALAAAAANVARRAARHAPHRGTWPASIRSDATVAPDSANPYRRGTDPEMGHR